MQQQESDGGLIKHSRTHTAFKISGNTCGGELWECERNRTDDSGERHSRITNSSLHVITQRNTTQHNTPPPGVLSDGAGTEVQAEQISTLSSRNDVCSLANCFCQLDCDEIIPG